MASKTRAQQLEQRRTRYKLKKAREESERKVRIANALANHKRSSRELLNDLLSSLAKRAGVRWDRSDEDRVGTFFDALEEESRKRTEDQLVGNGLIEEY